MAETIPDLAQINAEMSHQGGMNTAQLRYGQWSLKNVFGEAAADALAALEVGVLVSADNYDLARPRPARPAQFAVAIVRMESPEKASVAVSARLLGADPDTYGVGVPPKVEVSIPGYPAAVAYTQDWKAAGAVSVRAFLPTGRFVLAVSGVVSLEQAKVYFDRQTAALRDFVPTPRSEFADLELDSPGLARLTLAPESSQGFAVPVRALVYQQTDVGRMRQVFDQAGVDAVGSGYNTVYRARDEFGAEAVRLALNRELIARSKVIQSKNVDGVPGGRCVEYSNGGSSTSMWCVVSVGRFVSEVTSRQHEKAVQALGASYVILRDHG
ncbi:hypothetical protein TSHO111613_05925 [Tsukamurella hominis]